MTSYKQLMFTRTKKRALPFQTPSVRRLRPNAKVNRTNQFQDDSREENSTEGHKNGGFFNLENDVSTLASSDNNNNNLPRTEDDSDNNEDNLPRTEDDSDNSDDSLPLIEDDNNNEDNLPLTEDDSDNNEDNLPQTEDDSNNSDDSLPLIEDDNNNEDNLPLTEDDSDNNEDNLPPTEDVNDDNNDGRLPQTIEDEPNAHFEPIQGEYGPYFSNFTEQMLFFWITKHMIGNLPDAFELVLSKRFF